MRDTNFEYRTASWLYSWFENDTYWPEGELVLRPNLAKTYDSLEDYVLEQIPDQYSFWLSDEDLTRICDLLEEIKLETVEALNLYGEQFYVSGRIEAELVPMIFDPFYEQLSSSD